jgi:hypothetical protein
MSATSYPIPKPLWDALENVLMVKSKELIKEIALSLGQPEKSLLDAFKAKKHTFHLVDSEDTQEYSPCEALVCTHAVAHRCRKASLLGKKVCPEHEFSPPPSIGNKPVLQRIQTTDNTTYFVDSIQNVYTIDFQHVGPYVDGTLTLFEIDEEEEYA